MSLQMIVGATQNLRGQLIYLRDNAFCQYAPVFVSAIVACRRE